MRTSEGSSSLFYFSFTGFKISISFCFFSVDSAFQQLAHLHGSFYRSLNFLSIGMLVTWYLFSLTLHPKYFTYQVSTAYFKLQVLENLFGLRLMPLALCYRVYFINTPIQWEIYGHILHSIILYFTNYAGDHITEYLWTRLKQIQGDSG